MNCVVQLLIIYHRKWNLSQETIKGIVTVWCLIVLHTDKFDTKKKIPIEICFQIRRKMAESCKSQFHQKIHETELQTTFYHLLGNNLSLRVYSSDSCRKVNCIL